MYGSVAHNRLKPGKRAEFMKMMEQHMTGTPAGGAHLLIFMPESAPDDLWIAVAFESREAYQANSDSPEMQERYSQMQEFMAGPPEWHDGEVVAPWA